MEVDMSGRIIFVEDSRKANYGGGQRVTELLLGLFNTSSETVLIDVKGSILSRNCSSNCMTYSYPKFLPIFIIIKFLTIFFFKSGLKTVVCCTKSMLPICVFGKLIFGYRLVYYAHTEHEKTNIKNHVALWCARRCDRIICVSRFVSQFFDASEKICVIYNPILERSQHVSKLKKTDFYYIGAMTPSKGVDVLLGVATQFLDISISMIGVGKLQRTDSNEVNVSWLGFVEDPIRLIPTGSILILPSVVAEACPMVLLEAASRGVNYVTTDFGGQLELSDKLGGGVTYDGSASGLTQVFQQFRDNELKFNPFATDFRDFARTTFKANVKVAIYE